MTRNGIKQYVCEDVLAQFPSLYIANAIQLIEMARAHIGLENERWFGDKETVPVWVPPISEEELCGPTFDGADLSRAISVFKAISENTDKGFSKYLPSTLYESDLNVSFVCYPNALLDADYREELLHELRKILVAKEQKEHQDRKIPLVYSDNVLSLKEKPTLFYRPTKGRAKILRDLINSGVPLPIQQLAAELSDDANQSNGYDVRSNTRDMCKEFTEKTGVEYKIILTGDGSQCWFNYDNFTIDT